MLSLTSQPFAKFNVSRLVRDSKVANVAPLNSGSCAWMICINIKSALLDDCRSLARNAFPSFIHFYPRKNACQPVSVEQKSPQIRFRSQQYKATRMPRHALE